MCPKVPAPLISPFVFCPYHHFLISCDVQALILCSLILTNGTVLIYCKILYLQDRWNAGLLWLSAEWDSLSRVYTAFKILFSVCVVFLSEDSWYLVQCEEREIRADDAQPTVMPMATKFCQYNFHIMFDRAAWTYTSAFCCVTSGILAWYRQELGARCCQLWNLQYF